MQIRAYLRSYSLRSGALIFLAFGITLVAVRISIYSHSVRTAHAEVRQIIDAHVEELNESIELYGADYAANLVNEIIQAATDDRLYIALRAGNNIVGNFPAVPRVLFENDGWTEIYLNSSGKSLPLHLDVLSLHYADGSILIVGYNLAFVDSIKRDLPATLFENIELALALALVLSFLLVWLLNLHVKKFNRAFRNVRRGNLQYRMKVQDESDQFDRLAGNLNRTLEWLSAMLTTTRDLSNSLAHDLRTPISRHLLEIRAISTDPRMPADLQARLDVAAGQLGELVEMFDNILTISRAESRSVTELFEPIDLNDLVRKAADFYAPMVEEKHLELELKLAAGKPSVPGDKQLLGQAVLNLLDNAVKYAPDRGRIQVESRREGDEAGVIVTDSGPGVPEDMLEKVTQRFFRADPSRNTPGTGLGLSLVEAVAKLHQGRLVLENRHPGFRATLIISADDN